MCYSKKMFFISSIFNLLFPSNQFQFILNKHSKLFHIVLNNSFFEFDVFEKKNRKRIFEFYEQLNLRSI